MEEKIVNKLINSWNNINQIQSSILLIGPSHSGRSTYGELIKAYKFNDPNPNLKFDDAKGNYNLQGIISSKAIKIQTQFPVLYEQLKNSLKILDIPCTLLPPQLKKWTVLEQKITEEYTIAKTKKVGFLIFIDQKNTRSNLTGWKKLFQNFLQLFKPEGLNEQLLDSIGLVITKVPSEIKEDSMVNRVMGMKKLLLAQKNVKHDYIEELFKRITQNNRVLIFRKVSGDKAQSENILANWSQFQQLSNYTIKRDNIKQLSWTPQAQKTLLQYLKGTESCLNYLVKATKQLLKLQDLNQGQIRQIKKNRPLIQDILINGELRKLCQLKFQKGSKYLNTILRYVQLQKIYKNITQNNLEQLIREIIKFNLFLDEEDLNVFQIIFEGLEFKRITNFTQFRLDQIINNFKEIFTNEVKEAVFKKLILAENGNENKQFYQTSIRLLNDNFKQLPAFLQEYQRICKKKLIKFSNPRQALKMYLQELGRQKDKDKQFQLVSDIGLILKNKNLLAEAGKVYKTGRNVVEALICLKTFAQTDQSGVKQYISYLTELYLFQEALRYCYDNSLRFGYSGRTKFSESIKLIDIARRKYHTQGLKNNILQNVHLSNDEVKEISSIGNQSILKL